MCVPALRHLDPRCKYKYGRRVIQIWSLARIFAYGEISKGARYFGLQERYSRVAEEISPGALSLCMWPIRKLSTAACMLGARVLLSFK